MKKTQKPELKKKQQTQNEEALNKELLKVEKAFTTGLRAGPACSSCKAEIGDSL